MNPTRRTELAASLNKVQQHYDYDVTNVYDGEVNSVAILSAKRPHAAERLVLKVLHEPPRDDEYRALTFLQSVPNDQLWDLPKLVKKSDDPPFLLISYVPGNVLKQRSRLSFQERQLLGRDIARFAILETQFDTEKFKTEIEEPRGGSWRNWDERFERLYQLTDKKNLPTLTEIAQTMIALREQYYPNSFTHYANQVIHGDLRLPNLALRRENGKHRLSGIFDFETMRLGDMVEEMRGLHLLGRGAIDACNHELAKQNYPVIAPEKIKFWCVGRWTASLLYQIANNCPDPKEYNAMVQYLTTEYPDADWSELPAAKGYVW